MPLLFRVEKHLGFIKKLSKQDSPYTNIINIFSSITKALEFRVVEVSIIILDRLINCHIK
jgi:hypothetical protein